MIDDFLAGQYAAVVKIARAYGIADVGSPAELIRALDRRGEAAEKRIATLEHALARGIRRLGLCC